MSVRGFFGFVAGAVVGAAAGLVAGIMLAPAVNEQAGDAQDAAKAWDDVMASCSPDEPAQAASQAAAPEVGMSAEELRHKIEAARVRMDQIRTTLSANLSKPEAGVAPAPVPEPAAAQ